MQIWIDADACPVAIKEILYRAADRTSTVTTLVANQALRVPGSKFIRCIQVPKGFDLADNEIASRCQPGDLVITSDIPLADQVISKGAQALSPRGEIFDAGNIKAKLTMRNFMETLRNSGVETGGPSALSESDKKAFSKSLEGWLLSKKPSA